MSCKHHLKTELTLLSYSGFKLVFKLTESKWWGQPDRKAIAAGKGHCGSKLPLVCPPSTFDTGLPSLHFGLPSHLTTWPPWPQVLQLVLTSRCPLYCAAGFHPMWYDTDTMTDICLRCVFFLQTKKGYQSIKENITFLGCFFYLLHFCTTFS